MKNAQVVADKELTPEQPHINEPDSNPIKSGRVSKFPRFDFSAFRRFAACSILSLALLRPEMVDAAETPVVPRDFAAGVRIDWPNLTVELDAEVVMREGPLELLACSPQTKEHESILKVAARPTHVYQAMGLVGLTPGRPVRFNEQANRFDPPTGDRLDIRVRYTDEAGRAIFAYPENWLTLAKPRALEMSLPFVFAGSYTLPDGRFAADIEGTVICLVDFEAALIAIPALHSADNEQLWLAANTSAIPARGTKCTLLIRSTHRSPVRLDVLSGGGLRHADQPLDDAKLTALFNSSSEDARPSRLHLCIHEGASESSVETIVRNLKAKAGKDALVEIRRTPCRFEPTDR